MAFVVARGLVSPASALPCRPVGGGVGPSKLSGAVYCMNAKAKLMACTPQS
jgi:hypothetical protein